MLRYMNISTECISDSIGACHVLSLSRCCIFMPHRSNMYIDVACCYQLSGFLREHTLGLSSSAVICWEELVYVTWVWLVRHTWPISVAGTDLHDSIQDCLRVYLTWLCLRPWMFTRLLVRILRYGRRAACRCKVGSRAALRLVRAGPGAVPNAGPLQPYNST